MDDQSQINSRLSAIESQLESFVTRLQDVEARVAEIAQHMTEQRSLKRYVETKTGRSGEMSSRIAQRLAKCEAAIEILARADDREAMDHA